MSDTDHNLLPYHFKQTTWLPSNLGDWLQAFLVHEMDEDLSVVQVKQIHRECLLVKSLDNNRTQLDLIIEPQIAFFRFVVAYELVIGDQTHPEWYSLGRYASTIPYNLHFWFVLFLVEHENKDTCLMQKLIWVVPQLRFFSLEEARCLNDLLASVKEPLNSIYRVERY